MAWSHVEVKVSQSCPTLCGPMDYTVHGILQARILEWVAFPFSRDLPNPGIEPRSPILQADSLPAELSGKPGPMESAYLLFLRNWTWIFHGGPTISHEHLRSGADLIPSLLTTLALRGFAVPPQQAHRDGTSLPGLCVSVTAVHTGRPSGAYLPCVHPLQYNRLAATFLFGFCSFPLSF